MNPLGFYRNSFSTQAYLQDMKIAMSMYQPLVLKRSRIKGVHEGAPQSDKVIN
jgi:hypothetical protein